LPHSSQILSKPSLIGASGHAGDAAVRRQEASSGSPLWISLATSRNPVVERRPLAEGMDAPQFEYVGGLFLAQRLETAPHLNPVLLGRHVPPGHGGHHRLEQ